MYRDKTTITVAAAAEKVIAKIATEETASTYIHMYVYYVVCVCVYIYIYIYSMFTYTKYHVY